MRWFLTNPGFELGDRDWTKGSGWTIVNDAVAARSGSWVAKKAADAGVDIELQSVVWPVRPGASITLSAWFDLTGLTGGQGRVKLRWLDSAGATIGNPVGNSIAFGSAYAQSTITAVAPARTKSVRFELANNDAIAGGTMFADDAEASGDIIESIPASAIIREKRIVNADTVSAFDPLIGETKFSEFNAGMSDRWSGVYHFIPALGADLGELAAFIQRISKRERFFAYDPDHTVPLNGVVNGMVVDGAVSGGSTRIPVSGGPVSTTALAYGDYVEIGAQYFRVQRPLEIGPEGTGDLIVWPSVRATLADGEDVITDQPKMVARRTSEFDVRRFEANPEGPLSMSWIEYV